MAITAIVGTLASVLIFTAPSDAAAVAVRVDVGVTGTPHTGWIRDTGAAGGSVSTNTINFSDTARYPRLAYPWVYNTQRRGTDASPLTGYNIAVNNGTYTARLRFVETSGIGPGARKFDIRAENGQINLATFDIRANVAANTPYVYSKNITVSDGSFTLRFTKLTAAHPIIAAIDLTPYTPPSTTTTTVASGVDLVGAAQDGSLKAAKLGTVANSALNEASGLETSPTQQNVLWSHNDSGSTPRIFAMRYDGTTIGSVSIAGASANDWEDISIGPGPVAGRTYLYAADIGNNAGSRSQVQIYRIPEPTVTYSGTNPVSVPSTAAAERINLTYPGAAFDAESFLVDPRDGKMYLVQKACSAAAIGLYSAPANLAVGSTTQLTRVTVTGQLPKLGSAGCPFGPTSADMTPTGGTIAVRQYGSVLLWRVASGQSIQSSLSVNPTVGLQVAEGQGEAVALLNTGRGYLTTGEGLNRPINRINY